MNLQDSIERLGTTSSRFQLTPFAYPPRLAKTNKILEKKFVVGKEAPSTESLSNIASHIVEAVHDGQLQDVAKREWRQVAWCLWMKEKRLA